MIHSIHLPNLTERESNDCCHIKKKLSIGQNTGTELLSFLNTSSLKATSLNLPTNQETRLIWSVKVWCSNTVGCHKAFSPEAIIIKKKPWYILSFTFGGVSISPDGCRQTCPGEKMVECEEQEVVRRHRCSFHPTKLSCRGVEFILKISHQKGHPADEKVTT